MAISDDFLQRFEACGNNQQQLVALMGDLDETKRSLKDRLTRISSEPNGEFGRGRQRQEQIRKIKAKLGFLTDEREMVRQKLGRLKMDKKALNRVTHRQSADFARAFMAAAERTLNPERFNELEARAAEILLIE